MSAEVLNAPLAAGKTTSPLRWLHNAPLDLLVGCGLWSLPLIALESFLETKSRTAVAIVFYALALVVNYPHYAATLHRAWARPEDRNRFKSFTLYLTGGLLVALLLVHAWPPLLPWAFTLYVFWSPWHYTGQNYGLAVMFARRNGLTFSKKLRTIYYAVFELSFVALLVGFNTGRSGDRLVLSYGLTQGFARNALSVIGVCLLLALAWSARDLVRQKGWRPALPTLLITVTQLIWFLPVAWFAWRGIGITSARYSAGVLAILHSTQYLWVTSFYAKRDALAAGEGRWRGLGYFAVLVVVGIALFIPGPWLASFAFKADFTTSFLAFTALVNLHHFILDGVVWKLREKRLTNLLIEGDTSEKTEDRLEMPLSGWRLAFVPAAIALLALAGLDQFKFYLGASASDPARLARAEALNPRDALISLRLGQAEAATGNPDRARAALERAVATNPYDAESQSLLGRILIEKGDYQAAYTHYRRMVECLPDNTDGLVNFGVLADQLGNTREAILVWERATQLDPNQPLALVRLGDAYFRSNRATDATRSYEKALLLYPEESLNNPVAAGEVVTLVTKIGDGYVKQNDAQKADGYYRQAAELAGRAKLGTLQSTALVRRAETLAAANQTAAAALLYQQALAVEAALPDRQAEGIDWFNYAAFLSESRATPELSYAACLKAEQLIGATNAELNKPVRTLKEKLEKKLGPKAAEIRGNLDATVRKAQSWQP